MGATNSDSKNDGSRRILSAIGFLAGLFALLWAFNAKGGEKRIREDIWFSAVSGGGVGHTADALFLGSSRVSASIRSDVFDQILTQVLGRQVRSANLGMGGSTTSEYVLGLRRLQELNPEALRGSVVFIEAPVGMAEYRTWKDSWLVDATPELLSRYLVPADLKAFLLESETPAHQKIVVAADVLFGLEENLSRLRTRFKSWFDEATMFVVPACAKSDPSTDASGLAGGGGIQGDARSVQKARATAMVNVRSELANQTPRDDWDASTIRSLVDKIRELGAQPFFYEMPLSREMASMYDTPVRRNDKKAFEEALRRWNVPMLHPRIATTAEDFPDIWHLRKSRAPEFTQNLTVEFLEKFVYPAIRQAQAAQAAQAARGAAAPVRTDSVQAK